MSERMIIRTTGQTGLGLQAHLDDTVDAHDASAISYAGSTNLSATTVEAALDELDTEKAAVAEPIAAAHISDTSDAHDASAISVLDTAAVYVGTDVETVLAELPNKFAPTQLNAFDPAYGIKAKVDAGLDCSTEIMAFLALADSSTPKHFYFPRGTYRLSTRISVPFIPRSAIIGDGPGITVFAPDDGVGGFYFPTTLTHGITAKGFSVNWATSQTTTAGTAFLYGSVDGDTFFSHSYEDITVDFAYRGFSYDSTLNSLSFWGSSWKNVRLYRTKHQAFNFSSATAQGTPELSFDHVFVENTAGSSPQSTGSAFNFQACEVSMNNIGVEGWYDTAIFTSGGGWCVVNNLHIESHKFDAASSYACSVGPNTPLIVNGASISGATTANNTTATILFNSIGAGAIACVDGLGYTVDTTLGTATNLEVMWGNSSSSVYNRLGTVINSGGINLPFTGSRSTQNDASLVFIGKLPTSSRNGVSAPLVRLSGTNEALPAASVTYHGEIRLVKGGAGVADTLSVCRKDAADAYAWVTLI